MTQEIPEFGDKIAHAQYVLRPGGYAVIRNAAGEIAVALTPSGFVLPGGGQEDGETPEETAVREAFEEVGLGIAVCPAWHSRPTGLCRRRGYLLP